jgi:hypothetical protein
MQSWAFGGLLIFVTGPGLPPEVGNTGQGYYVRFCCEQSENGIINLIVCEIAVTVF